MTIRILMKPDPRLKMTIFYHGNTFDLNGSQQALDMTDVDDKKQIIRLSRPEISRR